MSVLKNVENKIKLVTITCGLFLFGCIVISLGSMFTAFHHLFFTLAPDDKYIRYTIDKAMYLVDETGLAQYNALKEKGFYSTIMGTNMLFSIFCDSIKFNRDSLNFTYYGRQRIERRSTNWRTLLNKDLEERRKSEY